MAQYFHRITALGLVANVPAVLLTGLIVPLGFLSLGAGVLWQPLGQALGHVLAPAVGALLWSVETVSHLSSASYRVPSPPLPVVIGFLAAAVLFSAAILTAKRRAARAAGAAVLVMALLIAIHPFRPQLQRGRLEVTVLDVGQGDSIFVAFPGGRTMLVDAGGLPGSSFIRSRRPGMDVGEDVVSPFLWTRGLKRLDTVVLTHAHQDHLGGLAAVLRNFQVGELWVGREVRTPAFAALLALAHQRDTPVIQRQRGDTFNWDGIHLRVLWPASGGPVDTARNDDSLVLRLETGSESVLLAGDIEQPVERALAIGGDVLTAQFLKIPHHGSPSSTTEAFLDSVRPRFVAISAGENNPFGHPSPDVLERIVREGARLYRTDRHGAITLLADGRQLETQAFLTAR
jgi:competence protein ComEC